MGFHYQARMINNVFVFWQAVVVRRMKYLASAFCTNNQLEKSLCHAAIRLVVSFKYVKNQAFDLANTHFIKKYSAQEIEFCFIY